MNRGPKPICRHPLDFTVTITLRKSKLIRIIIKAYDSYFHVQSSSVWSGFFYDFMLIMIFERILRSTSLTRIFYCNEIGSLISPGDDFFNL